MIRMQYCRSVYRLNTLTSSTSFHTHLKTATLIFFSLFLCTVTRAQEPKPIQFSGVILGSDTRQFVSFVSVVNKNSRRGMVSDYQGYFSLATTLPDTFIFSAIGYKDQTVTLPAVVSGDSYTQTVTLERDTFLLPSVTVYPWADVESFKRDFLTRPIPADAVEAARKNLQHEVLISMGKYQPMDGGQNSSIYFQQQARQMYYQGQIAPNQLLNPLAWAQFIRMIKEGRITLRNDKDYWKK